MSIVVPNSDKCLESGALASTPAFAQAYLQNLIFEGCRQEMSITPDVLMGREKRDLQQLDLQVLGLAFSSSATSAWMHP